MSNLPVSRDQRVLVLAPTVVDGRICSKLLGEAGLPNHLCDDLPDLCRQVEAGAGAAVISEESLQPNELACLRDALHRQEAWSDLPILVLTREGATSLVALSVLETLGNVTLLERPVRVPTLISALRTALRARERQYQIRDMLRQSVQTADTLRDEARRKDEFLAMLAHELRNPLAPIRNGVALLKQDIPRDDATAVLDMLERQVGQMVRLVDDLLDVSRILRGKVSLRREVLDLGAILNVAVETARPLIDAQRHQLSLQIQSGPMQVRGDAVRLAQVFANLLNNAAKYTDPGGRIELRAEVRGDLLVVAVSDNGLGISPDMLPHVFDLFSQAERSLDRSQGGLGLGLTLVRRLVQMHGGRAYAESAGLGRGSRFVVELPAIHHAEMPISVAPPAPRSLKRTRHRVLVVDDNRDAAHSLGLLLKASGHEVITRYDGPSAIEELSRFEPSVVLLDIGLPGMSGYDVARCIRNSRQELLLVAVTGYGQEEDYRSTAAAGFDRHLVKPVDLQTLHKLLESATQSAPTA